jgi:hypothetical protein
MNEMKLFERKDTKIFLQEKSFQKKIENFWENLKYKCKYFIAMFENI